VDVSSSAATSDGLSGYLNLSRLEQQRLHLGSVADVTDCRFANCCESRQARRRDHHRLLCGQLGSARHRCAGGRCQIGRFDRSADDCFDDDDRGADDDNDDGDDDDCCPHDVDFESDNYCCPDSNDHRSYNNENNDRCVHNDDTETDHSRAVDDISCFDHCALFWFGLRGSVCGVFLEWRLSGGGGCDGRSDTSG
jgi:hypothetical protein